jgi:hypothetical protein
MTTTMTRQSWSVLFLVITVSAAIIYSFYVFAQTQTNLLLAIPILWAIILPIISDFPYSGIYFLSLPAPFFGTLFSLLMVFGKYIGFSMAWYFLAVLLSTAIVLSVHIVTRDRTMFWKLPLSYMSRMGIGIASIFFLLLAMVAVNPTIIGESLQNNLLFYLVVGIFAYIATSMLYVNSSYRRYILSKRIETQNLEKLLSQEWGNIEKKFSSKLEDVDALRYYFNESLMSFLEGNYERSVMWGYMVINEETVVNPKLYVDDKRKGKPSFAEIRTVLQHSRRDDIHIPTERIRQVRRNLFDDALDLLEREVTFVQRVAKTTKTLPLST